MNNKFKKYCQVLTLFLVAALLLVTPFLPSSSRTINVYFIINLLIIALGAEAGLLSVMISKPPEEKKQHSSLSVPTKPVRVAQEGSSEANTNNHKVTSASTGSEKKGARVVEKSASEKIASGEVKMVDHDKMKKCSSKPNLFFIGGGETEVEDQEVVTEGGHHETSAEAEEEEVIAGKVLSGQELFTKSEDFIVKFRMQLKMQRVESRKKVYQKAY